MALSAALIASIFSSGIAITIWYQYFTRRKAYQLAWAIAFTLFALASIAEWVGLQWGWNAGLARAYYLFGATLVTGYLALGAVWLLWPGRAARITTGLVVVLSAVALISILQAPAAHDAFAELGWEALERPDLVRNISRLFNIGGTLLLVGGTLSSWWSMRGRPALRNRARGILTITIGVIVVATGGSLAGVLGIAEHDLIAITNATGAVIMLIGVLWADRRSATPISSSQA